MPEPPLNPFHFGNVVIDEFADRESELAEVEADMRNGQDLVIFAPRRLGKSSLVLKAAAGARRKKALVAYLNVMTAPNKIRLAERLAAAIYADVAAPKAKLKDKALAMFQGLHIVPTITVDPTDGRLGFSFGFPRISKSCPQTCPLPAMGQASIFSVYVRPIDRLRVFGRPAPNRR